MKKTTLLYLFCTLLNLQAFASKQSCEIDAKTNFKASYEIKTPQGDSGLNYYHLSNKRAFEYTQQGITEIWNKTLNDKAFLVRGFDLDKRSIEHEVIDLKMENKNSSWSKRSNIMDPATFDFDNVVIDKSKGCSLAHYSKTTKHTQMKMIWNKDKDILVSFEIKNDGKTSYEYTLTDFKKIDVKNNHLTQVEAYDRTDFADIGDNESDPFFRKMINLGFVAHHEENIINAQGQRMETEGHNH